MLDFIREAGFPAIALVLGGVMVVIAIVRNIALEKVKIQLTGTQSIQLIVVGIIFILSGFILQYFPPNPNNNEQSNAAITLAVLQTEISDAAGTPTSTPQLASVIPSVSVTPTDATLPTVSPQAPVVIVPTMDISTQVTSQKYCSNFYSVMVREGPSDGYPVHSVLENPNNLSNPDCLLFDYRVPDNSWIRISDGQERGDLKQHEFGWVAAAQFRPGDFDDLRIYMPDGVVNGLYCVTSRYGLHIRSCPNNDCKEVGTLSIEDCVKMDARSPDAQWVRIAPDQNDEKYISLAGNWVSTYFLAPFEFTAGYQSYFRFYFELLPSVISAPTPQG